jgi:hypothetical protein
MKAKAKVEDLLPLVPIDLHEEFLDFWTTSRMPTKLKEAIPGNPGIREAIMRIIQDECQRFERYCHALGMSAMEWMEQERKRRKIK